MKPDKSTERVWKSKIVTQVTRDEIWNRKYVGLWIMGDGESGWAEWIIGNTYLHNSWKDIPRISAIRHKSEGEPRSMSRKPVQRFKFIFWELFLPPWHKRNKSKPKSCTSFSFSSLVVTTLTDTHQKNKQQERAPITRTFFILISTCLAFTWPVWRVQCFCPVLKSSDWGESFH